MAYWCAHVTCDQCGAEEIIGRGQEDELLSGIPEGWVQDPEDNDSHHCPDCKYIVNFTK